MAELPALKLERAAFIVGIESDAEAREEWLRELQQLGSLGN